MHRCERCRVILTQDEADLALHTPGRIECGACDSQAAQELGRWLAFATIHTSTKAEAETEWCRRVRMKDINAMSVGKAAVGHPGLAGFPGARAGR